MGKFVKKNIVEKIKAKKKALGNAIKIKAMFKGKQGLYTFYSIWFSTLRAYASGKPSRVKVLSWKTYVIPFVPKDWTCDDKGYEGVKAKRRCKLIQHRLKKTGEIVKKDRKWISEELLPAFENDFKEKNLSFDEIVDMDDSSIESKLRQAKQEKKFEELNKK